MRSMMMDLDARQNVLPLRLLVALYLCSKVICIFGIISQAFCLSNLVDVARRAESSEWVTGKDAAVTKCQVLRLRPAQQSQHDCGCAQEPIRSSRAHTGQCRYSQSTLSVLQS